MAASLMTLPLEIRQQIFHELFRDDPASSLPLLRVSKPLFLEAQPYVFKRPLSFRDQYDLYDWMRRVGPHQLQHVRDVTLAIADINCHYKLRSGGSSSGSSPERSLASIHHLYESCLSYLSSALSHLPSIQRLTIVRAARCPSPSDPLYQQFTQAIFSTIIPKLWSSTLQSISFPDISHLSLSFILRLPHIRRIQFSGFSATSPRETLAILQQLRHLESLALIGPPPNLAFHQRAGYSSPFVGQSVVPWVIHGLRPLRSLSITDLQDPLTPGASPPSTHSSLADDNDHGADGDEENNETFLTEDTFTAIYSTHRSSLRSLSVSFPSAPSATTTTAFTKLLSTLSDLRHLSLTLRHPDPSTFLCDLPPSLTTLSVGITSVHDAELIAARLITERQWLPCLTEVTFILDRAPQDDMELAEFNSRLHEAVTTLRKVQVRAWFEQVGRADKGGFVIGKEGLSLWVREADGRTGKG